MVVEKLTCVPELKLAGGENVNDLGDELPEGLQQQQCGKTQRSEKTHDRQTSDKLKVWKNTAIREIHKRQTLDKLKSVTTID